jgi:hypothetical protein
MHPRVLSSWTLLTTPTIGIKVLCRGPNTVQSKIILDRACVEFIPENNPSVRQLELHRYDSSLDRSRGNGGASHTIIMYAGLLVFLNSI